MTKNVPFLVLKTKKQARKNAPPQLKLPLAVADQIRFQLEINASTDLQ
jgi:hypothetical protein